MAKLTVLTKTSALARLSSSQPARSARSISRSYKAKVKAKTTAATSTATSTASFTTTTTRSSNRAKAAAPSPSSPSYTLRLSPFARLVYAYTKRIPRGCVSTYAQIAAAIGRPRAYRAVGMSLSLNPFAPHVPCHRVVASGGSMGGFMGKKGLGCAEIDRKIAMLRAEGISILKGRVVEDGNRRIVQVLGGPATVEEMADAALARPL
jgi:methylated-DNA-[protein]-cysteine S-methyltransferase